ncbi:hypothetical protein [Ruegeria sp. SCP11]|uniref:hypothetical protein n=1 Tax=Ruegeria sp. SCP11 TaxID=3141378 RepID=UPI0033391628
MPWSNWRLVHDTHQTIRDAANRLTIKRAELEDRILSGLKEQLLHPDLIAEFAKAYQEEYNRLAGSIQQERSKAERDMAQVESKIDNLINAISDGMFHPSMKDKLTALEARKAELEGIINSASDEPSVYRWSKKYGGMGVDQLKEQKRLQKENEPPPSGFRCSRSS